MLDFVFFGRTFLRAFENSSSYFLCSGWILTSRHCFRFVSKQKEKPKKKRKKKLDEKALFLKADFERFISSSFPISVRLVIIGVERGVERKQGYLYGMFLFFSCLVLTIVMQKLPLKWHCLFTANSYRKWDWVQRSENRYIFWGETFVVNEKNGFSWINLKY